MSSGASNGRPVQEAINVRTRLGASSMAPRLTPHTRSEPSECTSPATSGVLLSDTTRSLESFSQPASQPAEAQRDVFPVAHHVAATVADVQPPLEIRERGPIAVE
jgi:hypothetical protein